jgi:hypothetical protein
VVQPGQLQPPLNQEQVLDQIQEIALSLGGGPRTIVGSLEYMIQHPDKLNRWLDAFADGVNGGESSPQADGMYAGNNGARKANAPAPFRSVLGDAYRFSTNEALDSNNSLSTRAGYGVAATILAIPGMLNDATAGALNSPYDLSYGAQGVYVGLQTNDPYRFSNGLMRSSVGLMNLAGLAGVAKGGFLANLLAGDYAAIQAYARATYGENSAAAVEAPFSMIVPGGGLQAHETAGGHLILKHVGQTEQSLMTRLANEPKISGSSSYYDRAMAENAVSQALDANQSAISTWLNGSAGRLRIDYTLPDPVGISVSRGATSAIDVNSTRTILVRDPSMPTGYKILTGFPTTP